MSAAGPNYKDTVNLPKTDFPMKADLVIREPLRLEKWEQSGLYQRIQQRRKAQGAPKFILHDGPPFANGDVHMGTALNKVIKDLVLKSKTMAGFETPYIPGWDCHGLPIEFKVVKETAGLGAPEIRRRCGEFARKWIDVQRASFRRLGVFGDWENPYLTLSAGYEAHIVRFFATCLEKGLVYRDKRPVQWSYGAKTALAEAEVEYKEKTSPAIFVKFPAKTGPVAEAGGSFVIWTTTPWTLPANLGIMVKADYVYVLGDFTHEDGRTEKLLVLKSLLDAFAAKTGFKLAGSAIRPGRPDNQEPVEFHGEALAGSLARHPFLQRDSKVICTTFVTDDTGTGQVHTAPGHGKEDYISGKEAGLGLLSPVDDDGKFTADSGLDGTNGLPNLTGTLVFDANGPIIKLLAERGMLLGKENFKHEYPHCWRSKTPIIFRSVEQFFLRIDDIRENALREIASVQWLPPWGRARIQGTVESRPDWCISRQRTWGVPLPVFYAPVAENVVETVAGTSGPRVSNRGPEVPATPATPAAPAPYIRREGKYLPHITRDGSLYAVNFRLGDSLPAPVFKAMRAERDELLKRTEAEGKLTEQEERRLNDLLSERVEAYLDAGHGASHLRDERIALLVRDALQHFDGEHYELIAWCVMPNHVHVVVKPLTHELPEILKSWKNFTALQANKTLGLAGTFWQEEYYDHLIRDEEDFANQVNYVLRNPTAAGLKNWKWVGWSGRVMDTGDSTADVAGTSGPRVSKWGPEVPATPGPPVETRGPEVPATPGPPVETRGPEVPATEPILEPSLARKVAALIEQHGTNVWFEKSDAELTAMLGLPATWTKGRDTLDVWIDSGCSSMAVTESHPELGNGGIADLYLEATDQHRGWFQSSLMCSVIHRGPAPYKAVMTHGFVTDTSGEKISKSGDKPINADHYYNKYGADLVRLWVSSVDWTNDVPFSDKLFEQNGEVYRRFRNTLRILLANLGDFDAAAHAIGNNALTLLDRWILERLHEVTKDCLAAYVEYDFRKVFITLNQFCAVDLSAFYVDITKDRMYCDAVDSPRRRSAQTAMHRVFDALCRLLAPILAYTADEAWEFAGRTDSVHEQDFPQPDPAFSGREATAAISELQRVRDVLLQEVDKARKEKLIGSNLEAAVTLTIPVNSPADKALIDRDTAAEFFILSDFTVSHGEAITAAVVRTAHAKCQRCWKHLPDVGHHAQHPLLCGRCAAVVR